MELVLESISKKVGAQTWLYDMDIALHSGAVTVLLGATQAGKTSLMRIMAGLDVPISGRVLVDGQDVAGVPVRERNVAMVYQQFINYPSMKVRDNIASPLKLRGEKNIDQRVRELAEKLHIEMFLDRLPGRAVGRAAAARGPGARAGQGRAADAAGRAPGQSGLQAARRVARRADALFAAGDSTVVYATTEPGEALLLGGYTAVMDAGELLQYGPTADVFHEPQSLRVARAFSDPPMNLVAAASAAQALRSAWRRWCWCRASPWRPDSSNLTVGMRASALRVQARPGDVAVLGKVELAEISGSDTFVHATTPRGRAGGATHGRALL